MASHLEWSTPADLRWDLFTPAQALARLHPDEDPHAHVLTLTTPDGQGLALAGTPAELLAALERVTASAATAIRAELEARR